MRKTFQSGRVFEQLFDGYRCLPSPWIVDESGIGSFDKRTIQRKGALFNRDQGRQRGDSFID